MSSPTASSWAKLLDITKNIGAFAGLAIGIYGLCARENPPWYYVFIAFLLIVILVLCIWTHSMMSENRNITTKSNATIKELNEKLKSQIILRTRAEQSGLLWAERRESIVQDIQLLTQLAMVKTRNNAHDRHIAETSGKLIRRLFENAQEEI